jgi:predicted extracellular nuclease
MRFARTAATALIASTTLIGVQQTPVATAATTDLFISEYIEGSSFNKAIEIYNGTGAPIDLGAGSYALELYSNGAVAATQSVFLAGMIADGDVFVVSRTDADPAILAVADQLAPLVINFNGDDAVVLRKGGAVIDAFGQTGVDPGSEWSGGGVDDTLRRKASVCAGDPTATDAFDASVEWEVFVANTFSGLGAHTADCGDVTPKPPVINEFSASTTDTDVEYVEVFGTPATDLSGYTVLEIEGDRAVAGTGTGTVDEVITLGSTDASGRYLANLPTNALENGTITLLLVEGFNGTLGTDLDTNEDGAFDAAPWTSIVDAIAVSDGGATDLTYGTPALGVSYDGLPFAPGGASRIPDGTDTDTAADWVRNDFDLYGIPNLDGTPTLGEAVNTPGAPNAVVEVTDIPATARPIWEVQGAGFASAYDGQRVIVDGFVVGDFQGSDELNGFYLQEPVEDADGLTTTSDGIFVFEGGSTVDVAIGDYVTVTGTVDEFNGLTEITSVESVEVSSNDLTPPASTGFDLPATDVEREALEGMHVTLAQSLTISEYFNFGRFGEIVLTTDRQNTPTAVVEPGPAAMELAAEQALARITLDDGRSIQNPDPARHPNGADFTLANLFRGGDLVANVSGMMDYSFGLYRIQPTVGADHTTANPRPTAPPDVGGTMTIAGFNVLNYFQTLDYPTGDPLDNDCGPDRNQECRGADDATERDRQLAKIVAAMATIGADVYGINEVENTTDVEAMADIVAALNDALGSGTYDYVATGTIGTDAIKVGFIYRPGTVGLVGEYAILDESIDPRFDTDRNRPALAQTFMDLTTGGQFTVAVNHLKSKGSACDGDPDTGDGQGNCNLTRTAAAQALADWLAGDPTGTGAPTMILGDLNSYDMEDPIDTLKAAGYTDLIAQFNGPEAYSYVFDGKVGYLDHALADADLLTSVTGAADWHINADETSLIDYDTSFKLPAQDAIYAPDPYRSSDHDPVLVGLDVCDAEPPTIEVVLSADLLWPPKHQLVSVSATVTASDNFDGDVQVDFVSVMSDEPDDGEDDGNTVDDAQHLGDGEFLLRAERSGSGDGRTYTITYSATDDCGNTSLGTATVEVPLSRAGGRW